MRGHYLAILPPDGLDVDEAFSHLYAALQTKGLCARYRLGAMTLFVTQHMPTLSLPGGGLLLGHLFTRDGAAVDSGSAFLEEEPAQLRRRILERFWGSYLLLQPDAPEPDAITVTRSPAAAGNVSCIHAISEGGGFITSDISLAVDARLYQQRIDWDFIAQRLGYPGIKTSRTGLADVRELLPGCTLSINRGDISTRPLWSPWDFVGPEHRYDNLRDAATQVRRAIQNAVQAWTAMDDTLLLELSGGLDSSIVAACLRHRNARIICCNLTTPVPGVDEQPYARAMASQLGVPLYTEQLTFDQARFEFAPAPDSVAPAVGPLQYAVDQTMAAVAERHDATAYYSGGGGDSVFCYLRTAAPAADAWKTKGLRGAVTAIRDLADMHQCTLWKAARLTLAKRRRPPPSAFHPDPTFLAADVASMKPQAHPWFAAPANALPGDRERIFDLAGNQLFQDQASRGTKHPLRFPLLSQPVMEACLRTPSWMWIDGGRNRAVARAAFATLLPPSVANRQSKATYMSYLGAVYERNKAQIADFLLSGRLRSQGLLDERALRTFLATPLPARDQSFLRVFDLCMVENWVRHQP
ncbi:asparagine synthase C-terminal domain-containing protein [Oleiagrimonas sp. C23AA]|uniref:asparagine synthase-related protein n=1 Tax=Oleiagrimonas sp. C23AA TaxID=2719047 RepID=UPI001423B8C8|nr:asparagine synthase C-terminal domain-containing protein [Oleiagrimonas sp. C23AA]NII11299.1 asparagine synthase [Oleiagrimonas sp. C23AA]